MASFNAADQSPVFDQLFTARQPIADTDPASTARAMGAALDDVVQQIADQVAASAPTVRASSGPGRSINGAQVFECHWRRPPPPAETRRFFVFWVSLW